MCTCDFDMIFTFVNTSWEKTMNYARVFLDVLTRPKVHFPQPSEEKYYLVDFDYTFIPGFLLPY